MLEVDEAVDAADLAATLTSLVVGAVEGVLRDVAVLDAGMGDGARAVVEHAGCDVFAAHEAGRAVATRRGEWVLLIEPGARLVAGWVDLLVAALPPEARAPSAGPYRLTPTSGQGWTWRRLLAPRRPLRDGRLFRRKGLAAGLAKGESLTRIAANARCERLEAKLSPARDAMRQP